MKFSSLLVISIGLETILLVFLLFVGPNPSGALKVASQKLAAPAHVPSLVSPDPSIASAGKWIYVAKAGHEFQIELVMIVLLVCIILQVAAILVNRTERIR